LNLPRTSAAGAGGIVQAGIAQPNSGFVFPKRYRLTKTDEYSSVFGFRRAVKSPHFLLHYRPRSEAGEEAAIRQSARLGIVVPKKLVKAAVRRNLIKRLARERFRLLRNELPACDLILRLAVRPTRELLGNRGQLAAEISELLLGLNRRRLDNR
jgi:ribonuclease P protein component